jgi:hypothetical protein
VRSAYSKGPLSAEVRSPPHVEKMSQTQSIALQLLTHVKHVKEALSLVYKD